MDKLKVMLVSEMMRYKQNLKIEREISIHNIIVRTNNELHYRLSGPRFSPFSYFSKRTELGSVFFLGDEMLNTFRVVNFFFFIYLPLISLKLV